ncbi:MAG: 3-methyl-2-oxobutanoate hydroxymethyltransferase [Phycisphaerales bacterium]|nr:MAG: 3-methyl-2-oxobutanoate hydroxymethyltransferase [Phycisphaerales bacterium]
MSTQPPEQRDQAHHPERIDLRTLAKMARASEPFACLACYDATTAKLCERAGVHLLLAGDSAAQVVLGFERTIDMPLDFAIHITAALRRGAPSRCIMADMPFLSYHAEETEALKNAGRFLTEGMADIVKLEADASFAPLVRAMTRAGIPVCAHVGLLPQAASITGYAARGRTAADARRIVDDAIALQDAGAAMLLVEAVPDETTEAILASTTVPLIGIGAGPACHGQILVVNDLLGMQDWKPRFVEPAADLAPEITRAAAEWVRRVAARAPGGQRYRMHEGEPARLDTPNKTRVTWEGVKPSSG